VTLPKSAKRLTAAQIKSLCERQHAQAFKERALTSLISVEWVTGEAAEDGLGVSDNEAKRLLTETEHKQFANEAEFQKYLKTSGQTASDLLSAIRLELASEKIRGLVKRRAGRVTRARVVDYFNTHRSRYTVPERRDIEAIATATKPEIEKVEREIRSGASFAGLAKRLSIDRPSNERGGVTLGVAPGQEQKTYDKAIFGAKAHVLTGPVYVERRYYVFEVTRIIPGHQQPLGEVASSITQQLPAELQQQALARFIETWRKKWTAKTDCSPGYVVLKCRQYRVSGATPAQDPYALT
jgi:parvulin-like peptidyl-prolyl isomerase